MSEIIGISNKVRAYVEVRSQHSRGSSGGRFGGPDTYVAVQVVPPGVEPLEQLNKRVAEKRGIEIIRVGEGYAAHDGPNTMLGRAKREAAELARKIEAERNHEA